MPRQTQRSKTVNSLRKICRNRLRLRFIREVEEEDDSIEDEIDAVLANAFEEAKATRYHRKRGKYRRRRVDIFKQDLGWLEDDDSNDGERDWQSDDEFSQKYRVSKESFRELVDLIKDDPVFGRLNNRGRRQAPPAHQLAVLLKYMGTEGTGGSNPDMRNFFHIGRGTAPTVTAL